MNKSIKTNSYTNQHQPWKPGYFIFDTATVSKRVIASQALRSENDDELACTMKQLTAVNVVDKALKGFMA